MKRCEFFATCRFANGGLPCDAALGAVYRKHYCEGDYPQCARYLVYSQLGRETLIPELYPNQHDQARKILASASREEAGFR
ncbi:MAG: hypothetical protein JXR37_10125 [Kiritimatiellae bacterium]|nr:hypothetical protein [Kiritimatiellia bacterium]